MLEISDVHCALNSALVVLMGFLIRLLAGVWGGKGQGKSFQTELIFKAMGIEPIIMSAGEMESEWAGLPLFLSGCKN